MLWAHRLLFAIPQFLLLCLIPFTLDEGVVANAKETVPSTEKLALEPSISDLGLSTKASLSTLGSKCPPYEKVDFESVRSQEKSKKSASVTNGHFDFNEIERFGAPDKAFEPTLILLDPKDRIDNDFAIPENLYDRVRFWFDIYTRYDENQKIIHHKLYPWIVFRVVNTESIIQSKFPRRLWQRRTLAEKFVTSELNDVRALLKRIASGADASELDDAGKLIFAELKKLSGNVRKNARLAAKNLRAQTGQKNFFADGLKVSTAYLPSMEVAFRQSGLPIELTRLPFVESSFNKAVISKAGAAGIWQFMDNTGKKFLMIQPSIDERKSPIKSSLAAAKLLKENYLILGRSWPLAITAYNHGPMGVRRASERAKSRDLGEIISRYSSKTFGFATGNFYAEFLAALYAQTYRHEIFDVSDTRKKLSSNLFELPRATRTKTVIAKLGVDAEEFIRFNPDLAHALKTNYLLPKGFRLHLDTKWRQAFKQKFPARKVTLISFEDKSS